MLSWYLLPGHHIIPKSGVMDELITAGNIIIFFVCLLQLGLLVRAATSGHLPPYNFIGVTMGSTAVLLIGWRAILYKVFPVSNSKKNDVYRRGNPFELFEVWKLFHNQYTKFPILFMPFLTMYASLKTGYFYLEFPTNRSHATSWTITIEMLVEKMFISLGYSWISKNSLHLDKNMAARVLHFYYLLLCAF